MEDLEAEDVEQPDEGTARRLAARVGRDVLGGGAREARVDGLHDVIEEARVAAPTRGTRRRAAGGRECGRKRGSFSPWMVWYS